MDSKKRRDRIRLSILVRDYLANGNPEYAITLLLMAKKGNLTFREIVKIAQSFGRTIGGVKSWLKYSTVIRKILEKEDEGVYRLSSRIEQDIEEAEKAIQEAGIDIEEIEKTIHKERKIIIIDLQDKDKIIKTLEKYVPEISDLLKLKEEYEKTIQELNKLKQELEKLREENEELRSRVEAREPPNNELERRIRELEEENKMLREKYRNLVRKIKKIRPLLEKGAYYALIKVDNEILPLKIDEERWENYLRNIGGIETISFTREGRKEVKKGIIRAACVCYDKQQ